VLSIDCCCRSMNDDVDVIDVDDGIDVDRYRSVVRANRLFFAVMIVC
jgi:hypothetical protein